jgi:hypothetical protein
MNRLSIVTSSSVEALPHAGEGRAVACDFEAENRPTVSEPASSPSLAESRPPDVAYLLWFAGAAGVLFCAALLQVGQDRQVVFPWVGCAIPETCAMYTRFGVDCPGCGLTRSFVHLAHGNVAGAWSLSPVSLLIFSFVVLQVPLSILHLLRIGGGFIRSWTSWNQFAFVGLLIAIILQWSWRLVTGELF